MLKLVGLFIGLAALAAPSAKPSPGAETPAFQSAPIPPPYAARDVFSGLGLSRS